MNFEQDLPSGRFTKANQQESSAQYFLFLHNIFKTLKIYIIVLALKQLITLIAYSLVPMYGNL